MPELQILGGYPEPPKKGRTALRAVVAATASFVLFAVLRRRRQ